MDSQLLNDQSHLTCPGLVTSRKVKSFNNCWLHCIDLMFDLALKGIVQAWVAHFVTPLKCRYDEYDGQVTSQKPHKKHKSPNKRNPRGVGADARPSSPAVWIWMKPCRHRGGRPCACLFQGRCLSDLIYSIN